MTPSRFEELFRSWQDGDASADELAEFEAFLRSDPDLRRDLVRSVLVDVHLYRRYATSMLQKTPGSFATSEPRRRRRAWEAVAAAIVVAISAVAVVQTLLRTSAPAHEVVEGRVSSATPTIEEGRLFEVQGDAPATVRLKDGSRVRLEPGSAGTVRGDVFELHRGSGSFIVGPPSFRLSTPSGLVLSGGAEFSAALRSLEGESRPELAVTVSAGSVDVDAWGVRDVLRGGEDRMFGPPPAADTPDYYAILRGVKWTLSEAIDRAVALAPGVPFQASLEQEDGQVVYSVDIAQGRKVREVELLARTGERRHEDEDDDDESALAAAIKVPLKAVIERALAQVPGRAIEAEIEFTKEGKLRADVKIFQGGKVRKVRLDLE